MIGTQELANTKQLGEFGFAGDDHVVPFEVAPLDIRGRTVQLGPILDTLLARHNYPEPVARLLAEACVVTVLLGTSLKFKGKFILQTRTDGPVDMLVADFSTPDSLRAYAKFDAGRLAELDADVDAATLLGSGVLALTIDQGEYMQRYQGIVELDGISLEEAARRYFRQSEQIPTELRLAVARQRVVGDADEHWRAGGVLAQFLPQAPERMRVPDIHGGDGDQRSVDSEPSDDAWNETLTLMATVEAAELTDPTVGPERLLYRLFHEHGVRVFDNVEVADKCSCSRDRIMGVLQGFTAQEIAESVEDGRIRVECEFCSTGYEFDPAEFTRQ